MTENELAENEYTVNLYNALIDNVVKLLPDDDKLKYFTKKYLEAISFKILRTYRNSDLVDFIMDRYKYFNESYETNGNFRIFINNKKERSVIEVVCPYAPHVFVTIEKVIHLHNLSIKFKAHPLISTTFKESKNTQESNKIVVIYFELEEIKDEHVLDEIRDDIQKHLQATEIAYRDLSKSEEHIKKTLKIFKKDEQPNQDIEYKKEQIELVNWLTENWFLFGSCSITRKNNSKSMSVKKIDQAAGIFNDDFLKFSKLAITDLVEVFIWKEKEFSHNNFSFSTIKCKSPILRFSNLMCLRIGIPTSKDVIEEHVFLGLIKGSSLQFKNQEVPIIRKKINYIFKTNNMVEGGYHYNQVIRVCNTLPKFELFRTQKESLLRLTENLLSISNPNEVYCFYDNPSHQVLEVIIVVPLSYTKTNLDVIKNYLIENIPHSDSEYFEVKGIENNWVQLYFDLLGDKPYQLDVEEIENDIKQLTKTWTTKVKEVMKLHHSASISKQLCDHYLPMMPKHYKASSSANETVEDILYLEQLAHSGDVQFNLTSFSVPNSKLDNKATLLYIYSKEKIDLNMVMPILQNFGFYILDQINSRIGDFEKTYGYIQSYRVQDSNGNPIDLKLRRKNIIKGLDAVFSEKTENDKLNSLILKTELNWRDINVIQLYRNYYLQIGVSYTKGRINNCLLKYPEYITAIYHYFITKFSPENKFGNIEYRKNELLPVLKKKFIDSLRHVSDIADDVILRTIFKLVEATIRTNYFIPKKAGETYISVKLNPSMLEEMPKPVPFREIYVHDVGFEATHIRFGRVARGGLRWSDRTEDFRTEVLGLVKTQQSKNVVIVPVGSKGGFALKKQNLSREELLKEGIKQYKKFISGMLDITDNFIKPGEAHFPNHIMPYDELDPYLVVAADKGTASFSDIANSVSLKYKFWLGDGFASGGSVGYDHKKEGITARGGWECVKLHFKELGKDIQTEETSVIGIGDMSGDVFGNGMILSKKLLLKAAFNHIHIFIDPTPECESTWAERKRLFEMPRSTWKDFDSKLISQGGGVFDRNSKEIVLTNEIKTMLNIDKDILNGEQLIKSILKMEAELIWFGGIGTYMKDENETHFQVGDQANNSVRINITECKAKVIGEGANLGITQLGRLAYDAKGGKLNSDAIDNSAGVNMSDYEVNIKILLEQLVHDKRIATKEEREAVLAFATNEVSDLVLKNNRGQHRLISVDKIRTKNDFKQFKFLINTLITSKGLDSEAEAIPSRGELERMDKAKETLQRPVLAKLQAYVKMYVSDELLEGKLIDDKYFHLMYKDYFPKSITDKYVKDIDKHQLKREIIATQLTNYVVNRAGITFFDHVGKKSGHKLENVAKVYLIFDEIFEGEKFRENLFALEEVDENAKYKALMVFENLLEYCSIKSLHIFKDLIEFKFIKSFNKVLKECLEIIQVNDKNLLKKWTKIGFDYDYAILLEKFKNLRILANVIFLIDKFELKTMDSLSLINNVKNIFGIDWLIETVKSVEITTDWELSHKEILLKDIESHKMSLIEFVIVTCQNEKISVSDLSEKDIINLFLKSHPINVRAYLDNFEILKNGAIINLTSLAVGVSKLNIL